MKTAVFAIDVGYGNTKYAHRAANNAVASGMFPSLAPLAASRSIAGYGESVLTARKVARIVVDQVEYEVGPDVSLTAAYGNKRSGGMPGGASQIYQRIAALIARDQSDEVEDIERIDKALREQTPFFFYGSQIDLAPYLEMAQPLISGVVKEMQNNVGRLPNVRSIILSGGGAALYATVIRRAFPRVVIEVIDAPCLANVRGFLLVGESSASRERR
ncbi:hypothetical protein [Burkholderia gladioli]|uniref:hypothetical protein n=1 Tax=Burkholderia gladioli TaxID=28095 RepID=UPI00163E43E2|nr:hypothetical protein [Burkholderia gladioli]